MRDGYALAEQPVHARNARTHAKQPPATTWCKRYAKSNVSANVSGCHLAPLAEASLPADAALSAVSALTSVGAASDGDGRAGIGTEARPQIDPGRTPDRAEHRSASNEAHIGGRSTRESTPQDGPRMVPGMSSSSGPKGSPNRHPGSAGSAPQHPQINSGRPQMDAASTLERPQGAAPSHIPTSAPDRPRIAAKFSQMHTPHQIWPKICPRSRTASTVADAPAEDSGPK